MLFRFWASDTLPWPACNEITICWWKAWLVFWGVFKPLNFLLSLHYTAVSTEDWNKQIHKFSERVPLATLIAEVTTVQRRLKAHSHHTPCKMWRGEHCAWPQDTRDLPQLCQPPGTRGDTGKGLPSVSWGGKGRKGAETGTFGGQGLSLGALQLHQILIWNAENKDNQHLSRLGRIKGLWLFTSSMMRKCYSQIQKQQESQSFGKFSITD